MPQHIRLTARFLAACRAGLPVIARFPHRFGLRLSRCLGTDGVSGGLGLTASCLCLLLRRLQLILRGSKTLRL